MALSGVSLAAATAAGPGAAIFFDVPRRNVSMLVTFSPSSGSANVALEGTVDGETFFAIATNPGEAQGWVAGGVAVTGIRANLLNLSTGLTVTASVAAATD